MIVKGGGCNCLLTPQPFTGQDLTLTLIWMYYDLFYASPSLEKSRFRVYFVFHNSNTLDQPPTLIYATQTNESACCFHCCVPSLFCRVCLYVASKLVVTVGCPRTGMNPSICCLL